MKITVVRKAATVRQPQIYCPWVTDSDGTQDKKS
jgi:hypothetical protein